MHGATIKIIVKPARCNSNNNRNNMHGATIKNNRNIMQGATIKIIVTTCTVQQKNNRNNMHGATIKIIVTTCTLQQ